MSILVIFGITLAFFLIVVLAMAVGVLAGRRSIRGSCGGIGGDPNLDGQISCSLCSNPESTCHETNQPAHDSRRETTVDNES